MHLQDTMRDGRIIGRWITHFLCELTGSKRVYCGVILKSISGFVHFSNLKSTSQSINFPY